MTKTWATHRWWTGNPIRSFFGWISHGCPRWWTTFFFRLKTWPHTNGRCYCPEGSITEFELQAFGAGIRVTLNRNPTKWPCRCDKIQWLLFPDSHEDEIEEYGLERLRAEYPGVEPI